MVTSVPECSETSVITRQEDRLVEFIKTEIFHLLLVEGVEAGKRADCVAFVLLLIDVPKAYFSIITA